MPPPPASLLPISGRLPFDEDFFLPPPVSSGNPEDPGYESDSSYSLESLSESSEPEEDRRAIMPPLTRVHTNVWLSRPLAVPNTINEDEEPSTGDNDDDEHGPSYEHVEDVEAERAGLAIHPPNRGTHPAQRRHVSEGSSSSDNSNDSIDYIDVENFREPAIPSVQYGPERPFIGPSRPAHMLINNPPVQEAVAPQYNADDDESGSDADLVRIDQGHPALQGWEEHFNYYMPEQDEDFRNRHQEVYRFGLVNNPYLPPAIRAVLHSPMAQQQVILINQAVDFFRGFVPAQLQATVTDMVLRQVPTMVDGAAQTYAFGRAAVQVALEEARLVMSRMAVPLTEGMIVIVGNDEDSEDEN